MIKALEVGLVGTSCCSTREWASIVYRSNVFLIAQREVIERHFYSHIAYCLLTTNILLSHTVYGDVFGLTVPSVLWVEKMFLPEMI